MTICVDPRAFVANHRRKYLHVMRGGTLNAGDVERLAKEAEMLADRIDELEAICQSLRTMLDEIAASAGYKTGEAYTVPALIARLRDHDR